MIKQRYERLLRQTKHLATISVLQAKARKMSTHTDQEDAGDYERSGKQPHSPTRFPEKDDADQNPHQHAHLTNEHGVAHGSQA